jgi:hypothetical protein
MNGDLQIINKRIDLARSKVLYDYPCTPSSLADDWEIHHSTWECRDGAFIGRNPDPCPGMLVSKHAFPGNVLVDCFAQTVLPSTHDIDIAWNMSWDETTDQRGAAYVAGVQGWWTGNVGIEKSPDYKLVANAPCPWFTAGKNYHLQAGSINGLCFLFVDGVLRICVSDPAPINSTLHNRVGFEAYQSMIKISRIVVRQIAWDEVPLSYPAEF